MSNKTRLSKLEKAMKTKEFEPMEIIVNVIGRDRRILKSFVLKDGIRC